MIAVDTNLLVYAHREESPWHDQAAACVQALARGHQPWAIAWTWLHEFFAIVTHPKIHKPPTPRETALHQMAAWLESPTLVVLTESAAHWQTLRGMLSAGRVVGPQVHEARIAALCVQHAVSELWTADRDFSRYPQVKTRNPLVG
jgi:uncharacterized protein